jgi:hypothetical protein
MQPPRRPWGNFPDVLIHATESAVKQHPAYWAAKTGDDVAALELVRDVFDPELLERLRSLVGDSHPVLVSAHAYEREGVNAIPEVLADVMAEKLGWSVDNSVVQTNVVAHTGADGFSRLARQPSFDGTVTADTDYILIDDFVGMGGTLANLRGHIESQGGRVLAAIALTGKPHSAKLRLTPERLHELRNKHGTELEHWWQNRFGHAFDALTESEARYLVRTPDAATIRDRLVAAEQAGNRPQDSDEQVSL